MRLAWNPLKRVLPTRRPRTRTTVGRALRAHRVASIGCAFALLTAGAGATTYVKIEGRSTLAAATAFGSSTSGTNTGSTGSAGKSAAGAGASGGSADTAKTAKATSTTPEPEARPSTAPTAANTTQKSAAGSAAATPAASASARSALSTTVSSPLEGQTFSGVAQVGTLFNVSNGTLTSHHCTGSVVDSPQRDIVITAAHCVYGSSGAVTDQAFVPDYDNGAEPFGVWNVSAVYVAPQWAADRNPDYDVAFIVVHQSGSSLPIEDVVGADSLAVDQPYTEMTDVIGYPSDTNQPITCTDTTTEFTSTQLQWDCGGYPGGTSGSPFLADVDPQTGYGTVVGVIGGYETGGDTPQVSYSVHFGDAVSQLLAQAEASN